MKFLFGLITFLFIFQLEGKAQKSCYNNIIGEVFVDELKKSVKKKDSSFIYFTNMYGINYGITAFIENGIINISEFVQLGEKIDVIQLEKRGKRIIEKFYKDSIYTDTAKREIYYVDDGGFAIIISYMKGNCWIYNGTGYSNRSRKEKWAGELYEFAWLKLQEYNKRRMKDFKK